MNINGLVFQWYRMPKPVKAINKFSAAKVERALPKTCKAYMTDNSYQIYSTDDIMDVLKLDRFKDLKYTAELRDCDDYTWALLGLIKSLLPGCAIGLCHMDVFKPDGALDYKHALACMISKDEDFLLIEPQLGSIFSPINGTHKPYLVVI